MKSAMTPSPAITRTTGITMAGTGILLGNFDDTGLAVAKWKEIKVKERKVQ